MKKQRLPRKLKKQLNKNIRFQAYLQASLECMFPIMDRNLKITENETKTS